MASTSFSMKRLQSGRKSRTDRSGAKRVNQYSITESSDGMRIGRYKYRDPTAPCVVRNQEGRAKRAHLHDATLSQEKLRVELHQTKTMRRLAKLELERKRLDDKLHSRSVNVSPDHDRVMKFEIKKDLEANERSIKRLIKEVKAIRGTQESLKYFQLEKVSPKAISPKARRSPKWDQDYINSQLKDLSSDDMSRIINGRSGDSFSDGLESVTIHDLRGGKSSGSKTSQLIRNLASSIDFDPARRVSCEQSSGRNTFLARSHIHSDSYDASPAGLDRNPSVDAAYGFRGQSVSFASKDHFLPEISRENSFSTKHSPTALDESKRCAQKIQSNRDIINRSTSGRVLKKHHRRKNQASMGKRESSGIYNSYAVQDKDAGTPTSASHCIEPNSRVSTQAGERLIAFDEVLQREEEQGRSNSPQAVRNRAVRKLVRRQTYSKYVNDNLKPDPNEGKKLELVLRKERMKVMKPKVFKRVPVSSLAAHYGDKATSS
mmetsp:Transcript_6380/g.7179  ORF Transcript_6380/g.7179 Transcript_6380/m.7179 type:complete len:489 (-) Transcript_6380:223-1689(-)